MPILNPIAQLTSAPLPAIYANAKLALAECERIDECQDWANRAEALASYARQANDDDLRRWLIGFRPGPSTAPGSC
jgi:hypothetical protein